MQSKARDGEPSRPRPTNGSQRRAAINQHAESSPARNQRIWRVHWNDDEKRGGRVACSVDAPSPHTHPLCCGSGEAPPLLRASPRNQRQAGSGRGRGPTEVDVPKTAQTRHVDDALSKASSLGKPPQRGPAYSGRLGSRGVRNVAGWQRVVALAWKR